MTLSSISQSSANSNESTSSFSFLTRFSQDASNAISDAYGSLVLGDDAGKSAQLVLVLHPPLRYLGMTFLEIGGRAYIRTVSKESQAAMAGVLPRDAIQLVQQCDYGWDDEYSQSVAVESEEKGIRTSYQELRELLGNQQSHAFLSQPRRSRGGNNEDAQTGCGPLQSMLRDDAETRRPSSPYDGTSPLVFVFRRTRQRPSNALVHFRLDDECDFAASLIRRLAPTADMEQPSPDTWEELVHDGTDWLLGSGSILPPKQSSSSHTSRKKTLHSSTIPLDAYEQQRMTKLAKLRSRMAAESLHQNERSEDVEAATIRGMIQKAVGLAFVRASKVVLGISVHGGSGIVISRLPDGTWSAPSAIGTVGLGLGVQFGLEVAEYIFILQTQESLEHFYKGGSFTIGGNIGAAIAGIGREAYGAASVGTVCHAVQPDEDEYITEERPKSFGVAPIVAYAKSQGLYVGVSLEGSRIFTRNDLNAKSYKFAMGRDVTAYDILSGKVATPPEAEDLYASLHSVEFTHEMSCLPRPPEVLRRDSTNAWYYDRSSLATSNRKNDPFSFLTDLSREEAEDCASFEAQFKEFMYGGVSVQRLIPNAAHNSSGKTRRERRTLWLMLPEIGALRLGFVSKLSDDDCAVSNKSSTQQAKREGDYSDLGTVASEEVTLDSALIRDELGHIRPGSIQLSNKHSVALTDVTVLSQEANDGVKFNPDDQMEHLRVISVQDVSGTQLLILANNFREAELLVCGLKLLLEQETARLAVRGGLPITALGGRAGEGAMSPTAARGFKEAKPIVAIPDRRREGSRHSRSGREDDLVQSTSIQQVPEGRMRWGDVPGRDYMRGQAAGSHGASTTIANDFSSPMYGQHGIPKYVHGQLLVRDIATDVQLPLPLPLCRVLLLDSKSPVITKWEGDRGDFNFSITSWTFPPSTPRELERHSSEHHLIASGSMMGANRTTSFDRVRNGSKVRLSETQIIDADDSERLAFTISERMPRRGFSVKVRVLLRASNETCCQATVLAELRAVGKNMTNQASVHKAFLLVLTEIKDRYGSEDKGLMAGFVSVVNSMPSSGKKNGVSFSPFPRTEPKTQSPAGQSQTKSGLVSLEEIMKKERMERPSTPSILTDNTNNKSRKARRPSTGVNKRIEKRDLNEYPADEQQPVTIEVKPLPKIRLSLMPSPREEDEEESSTELPKPTAVIRRKKKQTRRAYPSKPPSSRRLNNDF